jgi:hypothetical protein
MMAAGVREAAVLEHRPGPWQIEFTPGNPDVARGHAGRASTGGEPLDVMEAGRYGFAAVGTHEQVIALRDAALAAGGESFAITRAILAELFPRRSAGRLRG